MNEPATILTDDVAHAAAHLGMPVRELTWEIYTYAKRNLLMHNNTKQLIDTCHWKGLIERISKDLTIYNMSIQGREGSRWK